MKKKIKIEVRGLRSVERAVEKELAAAPAVQEVPASSPSQAGSRVRHSGQSRATAC